MYGATPELDNFWPIRQRRNNAIDVRFITNVVVSLDSLHIYLSVSTYTWTIYMYARAD